LNFFTIAGPGYMAMLADTDVGSIVTAAQSGARWGYRLLWIQIILIPVLYWVQELTVRLGLSTGKGQGRLIREHFGSTWARITAVVLFISVLGALVTEFVGIAGAGMLFHIPPQYSVGLAVIFLLGIVLTGSYRRLELIGIAVGLFEVSLVIAACLARPDVNTIKSQFFSVPIGNHAYLTLIAANVGAIIMPWMIFYQQGAIVDKGLYCACADNYQCCRWDTAIGSVFAQIIMVAALVLTAATIGRVNPNAPLDSVQQIADAVTPLMGEMGGKVLFAAGITSAALIASIVVSMAAAWGVGELLGVKTSFNVSVKEAPRFYITYGLGIVAAGVFVLLGFHLVEVTIFIEIVNALMLPLILGFLFLLAFRILPAPLRLKKWQKGLFGLIYVLISVLAIFTVAHFFIL
jgi:NRAMP (natural resistance-associated macrophage protein)-like metal ion transporter